MGYQQQVLPFDADFNEDDAFAPPSEQERNDILNAVSIAQAISYLRSAGIYVPHPDEFPAAMGDRS